ncbi:bifunctional polysaccharide deacetylase/glycosyltransferase family 2 protein [Micromonospora sp. NBC_01655]|uniref:bifunctional polysaccharide deacetylase/glycosyltransferase family 2 protein n=1 Tax=Micromonospora sp. NBC_01655 TaxID=2975983 RepID=UPI002250A7E4|nr:bifunctional polysaccharide deacetylase/glycosyltransferase family 2 protein [Micromonospora sp. NBC_01655]MCX4470220.1 bifunctional polysaccharide deacetylase/glycosyltransferase family 2 protein [Micromonospora sp. NBC_01655]
MRTAANPFTGRPPPPARRSRRARRTAPPPSWALLGVVLVVLAGVLFVGAYANAAFVPDRAQHDDGQDRVPAEVVNGGPVINAAGGQHRSYRLPPRTVALTFDDGPDPTWTREVLRVLDAHQVKGTFFVVGSQAARHPGLVRELVAGGHEVGVHTFTHPDLTTLPGWRRRLEYAQTQLVLAGAAGVRSSLIRFPYSSHADAIDDRDWPLVTEAGELGYLTVLNDTDSRDWALPGVDVTVANATPTGYSGAISLWHDAGGDRAQTVAALDRFIPLMKERGYRFTTATEGLNLALAVAGVDHQVTGNPAASGADRWRGRMLVWAVRGADRTLTVFGVLFVLVGVLTVGRTVLLFLLAGRHARRRRARDWAWGPPVTEPVSVIVPAYNEKEGIAAAVRSLATGDHPGGIEVVVVDDGSTDGTADIAEGLGLPNVRVVRKPNGGKPSALNTGVALARHELLVLVDGDTVFEPDAVRRLVQPFADPQVGAVAGNVKVGNRDSLIAKWQHIEYVIGFNLDRRLYETLRCMSTVPGAIGGFRRQALGYAGGLTDDTLAEDTDITMALGRAGWKVVYEETARAWTEAPATMGQLWKQRYRWSYGTMQAMWKHRRSLLDHGASGRFSRRCLLFLSLFGVLLPLLAPMIDLLALYGLFFLDRTATVVAWLAMLAVQFLTAVVAFRLDRERLGVLWVLPLQQFVYRQLMYLVMIQSVVTALTGGRLGWQKLRRTGLRPTARAGTG